MPFSAVFCGLFAGVVTVAWWIFVRYPGAAPRTMVGVTAWFCTALVGTALVPVMFARLNAVVGPLAAFLLVVLPSGVCVMLVAAWTIRFVGKLITPGH